LPPASLERSLANDAGVLTLFGRARADSAGSLAGRTDRGGAFGDRRRWTIEPVEGERIKELPPAEQGSVDLS
jgi:hypothetical protein